MLTPEEVLDIFRRTGVLWEGHFILTSGLHAERYLQCAQVLQYPDEAAKLCAALAEYYEGRGITAVVGPATGAIIIAYEVARSLKARALFTERVQGEMTLRRGFQLGPEDRVLVVEDVITTGGSVKEVIQVVRESGAQPVGAGAFVDRSGGKVDLGIPLRALLSLEINAYPPEECPLCRQGLLAVKPGSRDL
ncbi:orotate phosphoribosyltransferase [Thermanaeromonas sp. C210]|uniref:orotate phosphoribosyltransferase n=1 Tax=Thermanaeromonas sp. C210 TaxID=2731925 RepID=UPI00155C6561|nr:orotate phosphoribosyltransferase [Thermanaeromonas sp. C210]GFN22077.1 orotate phosphoribosyltransferase [Thermanaeromonas sp. C210]